MTLKDWNEIYKYWNSLEVPNMTLVKFEYGKHTTDSPWFEKKRQHQFYHSDNPILQTGFHLGHYLNDKPQELIDAYKIFSYLRYNQLYELFDIVKEPFKRHNEDQRDWWNSNAKNIFPYYESINNYHFNKRDTSVKDIKAILDAAAHAWKDIANEWSLIIIPNLMIHNSEEYKDYQHKIKQNNEQREYQEYLRLKKKYEGV